MGSIPIFLTISVCSLKGKGLVKQTFVKYLLKRSFQLFSKATTFNLMKKFTRKYQEQLLKLNLHHLTLIFSWMKWKPVFLKHNISSYSFGSDILTAYFCMDKW